MPSFSLAYRLKSFDRLLPYQGRAVSILSQAILQYGCAADGSDTGLGKTYHALKVCEELNFTPAIICRKAGIAGWKRACTYFQIDPVFIVNWELIKTGKTKSLIKEKDRYSGDCRYQWNLPKDTLLIFDEAHMACNDGSLNNLLWTASRGLASISMSATFADRPTRLRALLSVLRIIDPRQFDQWVADRGAFQSYNHVESLTALDDMKEINKILFPQHGCRLRYDDPDVKKHFPDAIYQTEIVSLTDQQTREQNRLYQELIVKAREYHEKGKSADRQANPTGNNRMVAELRYRQSAELLKSDAVAQLAENYMDQGASIIIFVNFRETLAWLAKRLNTKSLIFGGQEQLGIVRESVISDFQENKTRIIVSMVDAGGVSISLHDLKGGHPRISLICPTYNPVSLKQVLGRTYRAGAKTTPVMKLVYAAGTIEEKVSEVVNRKLANISALNDGDLMEPDLFQLG